LKDFKLKSKENLIIKELQDKFFSFLGTFVKSYPKMFGNKLEEKLNKATTYETYFNNFSDLSEKIKIEEDNELFRKTSKVYNKYDPMICDYFKYFLSYDNRKYSKYSKLIDYYIDEKDKKGIKTQKKKKRKRKRKKKKKKNKKNLNVLLKSGIELT